METCARVCVYVMTVRHNRHAGNLSRAGGAGGKMTMTTTRARRRWDACTANGRDEWSAEDCRQRLGCRGAVRTFVCGHTGTRARSSGTTAWPRACHPRRPADDDPVLSLSLPREDSVTMAVGSYTTKSSGIIFSGVIAVILAVSIVARNTCPAST